MNMPEIVQDEAVHAESLRREARQADVVVFHSRLTDTRALCEWLQDNTVDYRLVEMSMGSAEERSRYRALEQMTGWRCLPQVFSGGEFVGGAEELYALGARREGDVHVFPEKLDSLLRRLGYAGLIPFVAGTLGLVLAGNGAWSGFMASALVGYAAVILTFLGAVHWGRVLNAPDAPHASELALWSVTPSILAWAALLLPINVALPLMALLFVAVYAIDRQLLAKTSIGEMYLPLRLRLTTVVASLLTLAWVISLIN